MSFCSARLALASVLLTINPLLAAVPDRPNIVLVMADDQGWGQTGYYHHPVLKTPNLDAMAEAGLRFDRFYAAAPVCSPTRASVLTGRSNMRTGVDSHGYALRRQEKTLAQALRAAGYATGHFGKWHLNGMRGPGVPIFSEDTHSPAAFGFTDWLSVTNFFDRDPIMSRRGKFTEFHGDSSEIIVGEAVEFIRRQVAAGKPSFSVIWYGTPHSPFRASPVDSREFEQLDANSRNHYGELVAMDRSIGTLRKALRDLDIADNTLVWFCSDNGGLPKITPETVGGLRGFKGSLYEGGLRVPAIIEWPTGITTPRVTQFPAVTMDIFPTIAEIVGLPDTAMLQPQDGISLHRLFSEPIVRRDRPIPFSCFGNTALIDNQYKLLHVGKKNGANQYELYNLRVDPREEENLYSIEPEVAQRLKAIMTAWQTSMNDSVAGKDYAAGRLIPGDPEPRFWTEVDSYRPYFNSWKSRPEYKSRLRSKK
jgi:arylsulfatase A-like enzyme